MLFRPTLLVASAGLAVAQSLSSQCSSALLAVVGSSEATCLDLSLLAPLAASGSSNTSIIPTVNTWLTGMCSLGPCSNATLQAIAANITAGCSSELTTLGLTNNDGTLTTVIETLYPAFRQIYCLKDTSTSTLCVTEQLTNIQSATTTLSIDNIGSLITQAMSGTSTTSVPQTVTCSDCSKAAYTILAQDFPSLITSEQAAFQSKCGSSFTDGQMPSEIQETATNSTTSTGGATSLSVSSLNVGVAMLIAVSSAFVVFA